MKTYKFYMKFKYREDIKFDNRISNLKRKVIKLDTTNMLSEFWIPKYPDI